MQESVHSQNTKDLSMSTNNDEIGRVKTSGQNDEYIIIGNTKYLRHELMQAFGGTLNPGLSPPPSHQFANPSPLGLTAFGITTFILSMFNARAMGVTTPNVVVGMALFYGGVVQLLSGVWELLVGNTFGGTALTSYGAFWLSFAAIYLEAFGIAKAYEDDMDQFHNAVGFFLLGWAMFTFMLTMCTLKSTLSFCFLFSSLTLTFILLAAGNFSNNVKVLRAGGVVGVICGFSGCYNAFAGTANKTNSYMLPHVVQLTRT